MNLDINKFSFAQLTSNRDGKTSGSGTMGVILCAVGALCFLIGCIAKIVTVDDVDILIQSVALAGIGASLLAHRNHVTRKYFTDTNSTSVTDTQTTGAATTVTSPIDNISSPSSTPCEICEKDPCECTSLNS